MIEIIATTGADGFHNTKLTMNGTSAEIGAELAAINAAVLEKVKLADGVSVKVFAHAVIDTALHALKQEDADHGGN